MVYTYCDESGVLCQVPLVSYTEIAHMRRHILFFITLVFLFVSVPVPVSAQTPTMAPQKIRALAACLREKKFVMHGESECSACAIQRSYFGSFFPEVPYISCDKERALCDKKNIHAYPTWEDAAGKQYKGAIPLPILEDLAGCKKSPESSQSASLLDSVLEPFAGTIQTIGVRTQVQSIQTRDLVAAFLAGFFSFFAPCLLPLLPAYFSVITGYTFAELYGLTFEKIRKRVFLSSLFFVGGFTIVYTALGATGSIVGIILSDYLPLLLRVSGLFLIALGIVQTGLIHISALRFDYAWKIQQRMAKLGYLSAVITGIAAGLSWIPCVGPLLSSVLLLSARSQSVAHGVLLLFIYAAGLTIPFLLAGLFFPKIVAAYQEKRRLFHAFSVTAGLFMIAFGIILVMGQYRVYLETYKDVTTGMLRFFSTKSLW